jgi:hypothetical protein
MQQGGSERLVATLGALVSLAMVVMKVVPGIPGHFNQYEWLALAAWIVLGVGLGWQRLKRRES